MALRLGKTLAELEQSLSASEFYYWVAFDRINPIGDERHDWHSAQITSAIYRSQGAKVEFEDCLMKFRTEKKEPVSMFEALSNLFGK